MSRFAFSTARALAAVLVCVPLVVRAQTRSFGSGTAVGVTVQAIGTEEGISEVPAVALHVTAIRRSGLGVDFTVATLPTALASGLVLIAPDLGLARVLPIGGGGLMIKGGPSAVIIGGPYGGVVWGFHVGAAAFVRLSNGFGIRAEIVPHVYSHDEGSTSLTTFGIGFTSLPARRR